MEQPPGSEKVAVPHRAMIGPRKQIEARIFRTRSYGTSEMIFSALVVTTPFSNVTFAPSRCIISIMKRMSDKSGTLRSTQVSGVRSVAAKMGRAEFFEPLISTRPVRRAPPLTTSLSIIFDHHDSRLPGKIGQDSD